MSRAKSPNSSSEPPPGYCDHIRRTLDADGSVEVGAVCFILPLSVADALSEDLKRQWQDYEDAKLARLDSAREERERAKAEEVERDEKAAEDARPKPPVRPRGTVAAFEWEAARTRLDQLRATPSSPDKGQNKRDIQLIEALLKRGPWRRVALPRNWRPRLQALAVELPHFAEVLTFVAQRLALAKLAGAPLVPPPILLAGDPGVGKTHFTHRLAEVLGTPVHRETFDNAETGTSLRGSSRHWSNTQHGALFRLIGLGEHANPVVLLDEIDKCRPNGYGRNPLDALLTLLEPVSNTRVKDESVEVELDCSYVWYVATANDLRLIPAPLRSRFVEFTIDEPDIDGRLLLANAIFASTLARLVPRRAQRERFRPLTNLQVCRLAWHTPRQIRMAVERACGAAALAKRWHIEDEDLELALTNVPRKAEFAAAATKRPGRDPDDAVSIVVLPV